MADEVIIQSEEQGGVTIVSLKGRLDAVSSEGAEESVGALIDASHNKLILDFSGVEYLSSAGMRMLLSTTKKLRGVDGRLVLCCVSENVMDVFKMSGFDHLLAITTNREEGLKSLQ